MTITRTMQLYQAGRTREEAIQAGANVEEFDRLEAKYKGGSIPSSELYGFKPREPYSCDYHTGGAKGAALRAIIKEHNQ